MHRAVSSFEVPREQFGRWQCRVVRDRGDAFDAYDGHRAELLKEGAIRRGLGRVPKAAAGAVPHAPELRPMLSSREKVRDLGSMELCLRPHVNQRDRIVPMRVA